MANLYLPWFRMDADTSTVFGCARREHVLVRGWGAEGLPTLMRAETFESGGAAEAALQGHLEQLRGKSPSYRMHSATTSVPMLLAAEVAARPNEAQSWRNYADWAWRHADPRGSLVELHEAAEQARSPAHVARVEREIEAHEQAHHGAWRRDLIDAQRRGGDGGELQFRRGHLFAVSGMPRFKLDERAPAAIAELSLELRCPSELGVLAVALEGPHWSSLQRFEVRLACTLDDDQSAALFDLVWRTMPRLTRLDVHAAPGALTVGSQMLTALGRLLGRHRKVICGEALECLAIDLLDPVDGWTQSTVNALIDVLAPSGLRDFMLRAPTIPEELSAWAEYSGFSRRLARCVMRRRIPTHVGNGLFVMSSIPPAPPRSVEQQSAELAVWADWLQARGDALGELAVLWSLSEDGPAQLRREQIDRARAKVECELACAEGLLDVAWSGPLIDRVRLRERPLAAKAEAISRLDRVLGSPACARLDELEIADIEPTTLAHLLRLARMPGQVRHSTLAGLIGLTLSSWCRIDLGALLDVLPDLQQLTCRTPNIALRCSRPHLGLRSLTLKINHEDPRGHARLFSGCHVDSLPNLRHLTLELEQRWRGRPLPFERLMLAEGAHLTIRGLLVEADVDVLMRWASLSMIDSLEIANAQEFQVGRHIVGRMQRMNGVRLLGPYAN